MLYTSIKDLYISIHSITVSGTITTLARPVTYINERMTIVTMTRMTRSPTTGRTRFRFKKIEILNPNLAGDPL